MPETDLLRDVGRRRSRRKDAVLERKKGSDEERKNQDVAARIDP